MKYRCYVLVEFDNGSTVIAKAPAFTTIRKGDLLYVSNSKSSKGGSLAEAVASVTMGDDMEYDLQFIRDVTGKSLDEELYVVKILKEIPVEWKEEEDE